MAQAPLPPQVMADPVATIFTEAKKLGTVSTTRTDDDMAALKKSATIQYLVAMIMDLQARVKAIEAKMP